MTLWVVAVSLAILLLTKYSFFIVPVALGAWLWSVDSNGYFLGYHPPSPPERSFLIHELHPNFLSLCCRNYNSDADANATLGVGSIMIAVAVVMDKFLDLGGSTGMAELLLFVFLFATGL